MSLPSPEIPLLDQLLLGTAQTVDTLVCLDPAHHLGVVRAAQANFYRVHLIQAGQPEILCTRRSLLKKLGQSILVGDVVEVSLPPSAQLSAHTARGVVEGVRPRQRQLPRPAIANADQALIVMALSEPEPDPWGISRFLIQAEASGLTVRLCFNKLDTVPASVQAAWGSRAQEWGYEPLMLSAKTGEGLDQLKSLCRGRISVLTGFSGVGKSSLLNALQPELDLATQAVSGRLQHGRHTTRHVELFSTGSGWIADSPGFNRPDLNLCTSQTLIQAFPEVRAHLGSCQFRDCLHQDEPGCAIRDFHWERYDLYRAFLAEILQREQTQPTPIASTALIADPLNPLAKPNRTRSNRTRLNPRGISTVDLDPSGIPRLDPRYRRASRRQHTQKTQPWDPTLLEDGSIDL